MWRMVLYWYCSIDSNLVDAIVDDVKSQLPHMFTENKMSILEELYIAIVFAAFYKLVAPIFFSDTSFFQTRQWFVGVSCIVLAHRRLPLTQVWSRALTWSGSCCTCTSLSLSVCNACFDMIKLFCCTCTCVCVNACFDMIRLLLSTYFLVCVCYCQYTFVDASCDCDLVISGFSLTNSWSCSVN